jgi:hypothetical protein
VLTAVQETPFHGKHSAYAARAWMKAGGLRSLLLPVLLLSVVTVTHGQQVQGSIGLTAILPSTVRLNPNSFAIEADLNQKQTFTMSFPLIIQANLERRAQQLQVLAYFSDSRTALVNSDGTRIPASDITLRIDGKDWKTFPGQRSSVLRSGLLLLTLDTSKLPQRFHYDITIQVRLDSPTTGVSPGKYSGRLDFETIVR